MFAVISVSTLGAMVAARAAARPADAGWSGVVVVATLFFALANAILIIPLGLVPSWLALASTGFDVLALGWRLRCGTPSTRARRCAPTCCARSSAVRRWRCCSVARR